MNLIVMGMGMFLLIIAGYLAALTSSTLGLFILGFIGAILIWKAKA